MTDDDVKITSLSSKGAWSNKVTYLHGQPDVPKSFNYASSGSDNHILTWKKEIPTTPSTGVATYNLRWTGDDPDLVATEWKSKKGLTDDFYRLMKAEADLLEDGKTYTFELTAIHGSETFQGANLASDPATKLVPMGMVPTPTLPETAALLLALLLLGSGAYVLRRRQSSGLISA